MKDNEERKNITLDMLVTFACYILSASLIGTICGDKMLTLSLILVSILVMMIPVFVVFNKGVKIVRDNKSKIVIARNIMMMVFGVLLVYTIVFI